MKLIENEVNFIIDILQNSYPVQSPGNLPLAGRVIIDVGCGDGRVVRSLTAKGAQVTGLDKENMIAKAMKEPKTGNERYIAGKAELLPFKDHYADAILFFASLHHVPEERMKEALDQCHRVLNSGGVAMIIEPVGLEGSYFEVVRLVGDEREIQAKAHQAIKKSCANGFTHKNETLYYFERSYQDYIKCLNIFVDDPEERDGYFKQALPIARKMAGDAGVTLEEFRFKSICRLDVIQKVGGSHNF